MRAPHQLLHSRARVRLRYALFPLEGYPLSKLPAWPDAEVRILASPALGAEFAQYFLTVPANRGTQTAADGRIETFFYVLDGEFRLNIDGGPESRLTAGGFALIPSTAGYQLHATSGGTLLMLKKVYERVDGIAVPGPVIGNESDVPAQIYLGDEASRLQTLIPDEIPFDLAMNIFTFAPGRSLPVVETHIMEHGLYFLQGKGVYYLDDEWMEVEAGDFIWMGPYVPQSFYATGPTPSRYIYYKNVNRDVVL
ncbi:MAG: (S)-ureidoglycine aminohydrolase [Planctomycetaceae bacterium]|nr:(S)-ureidoglycine aminohydrolase [Planctomycetaceae bacterium]